MTFYDWVQAMRSHGLVSENGGPMSDLVYDILRDKRFPVDADAKRAASYLDFVLKGNELGRKAAKLLVKMYKSCWPKG